MRKRSGKPVYLKDYRPPTHLIDKVEMDVALGATGSRIRTRLSVRPNPDPASATGPLVLDGEDLELRSIALDGVPLTGKAFIVGENTLTLAATPPGPFVLETTVAVNPSDNTQLMGLYRSNATYCTQCEAEGFRRITYFPDRPDILSVYTVRLEADRAEAPVLLANGNMIESGTAETPDRHYAIWHDPFPKPSYLFAMVGGDLDTLSDTFATASGREVDLNIYCEHGKAARCTYAMDALKRSMRWDEDVFGREYDLDVFNIVAVSDFNMGAMENKGLNIFNDKYVLAAPETATDQDYANIEAVIAHEYFHNWTGNRITCRDWFQLCLKEGLTVFRDQEFSADMRSRAVKRIQDVRALRSQQFPEDAGPLAHPVRPDKYQEINNFYTATVYEKGAEIIRMLQTVVGADAFRAGMDLYFERHDGDAATVEQFLACFAEASGRDLTHFSRWYEQAGTPEVTVASRYDPDAATLTLSFQQRTAPTQGQADKTPLSIPVRLGLVGEDGSELALSTNAPLIDGETFLLEDETASVTFSGVHRRPVVSAFRRFSAPVRISFPVAVADLVHLATFDRDPFNRWQAVQDIANLQLKDAVVAIREGRAPRFDGAFAEALRTIIGNDTLENSFRALAMILPGEADIAREVRTDIDPDAIHEAREAMRRHLAYALDGDLLSLYRTLTSGADGAFSPDAESAGRRALANAALDYLAAGADRATDHLVVEYFHRAATMTDRIAALGLLVAGSDRDAADAALADYYDRFRNDALAIDKWFTVQATAPRPDTLERVRELTAHPAFSVTTPNRVRALIGAFALANQRQFNRPDGAGFDFIAERVADIDGRNPHVAARLLSAFRSWRALEPVRRGRAEAALARLAEKDGLSVDVRDILDRTLGSTE